MDDDDLDIYGDLVEFQQVEDKKSKELAAWEEKYDEAVNENSALRLENKGLLKKIKTIEINFQNLLDTAKAEVRRQEKLIAQLRKEKDDICFRRKRPKLDESHENLSRQHENYQAKPKSGEKTAQVTPVEETHKSSNAAGGEINKSKNNSSSSTAVANGIKARYEDSHRRHERDPRVRHSRHDDDADRRSHHNNDKKDKPADVRRYETEKRRRDNSRDRRDRHSKDERRDPRSRTEQQDQKRSADRNERRDRQSDDKRGCERLNNDSDDSCRKERHSKEMEEGKKPKDLNRSVDSKDSQLADALKGKIQVEISSKERISKAIKKTSGEDTHVTAVTDIARDDVKQKSQTEPPDISVNSNSITSTKCDSNQCAEISPTTPQKVALYNELFGKPTNTNEKKASSDKDLLKNVFNVMQNIYNGSKHTKIENEVKETTQVVASTCVLKSVDKKEIRTIGIDDDGKNKIDCSVIPGLDLVNTSQSAAKGTQVVSDTFNSKTANTKNKEDVQEVTTIDEEAENKKEILRKEDAILNEDAIKDQANTNMIAAIKDVTATECNLNLLAKAVDILEADAIKEAIDSTEIAKTYKEGNNEQTNGEEIDTTERQSIVVASEEVVATERKLEPTQKIDDGGEDVMKNEDTPKEDNAFEGEVDFREKISSERVLDKEEEPKKEVALNVEDQSKLDIRNAVCSEKAVRSGRKIVSNDQENATTEEVASKEDVASEENASQQNDKNAPTNAKEEDSKTVPSKEVAKIEGAGEKVSKSTGNDLALSTTELSEERSIRKSGDSIAPVLLTVKLISSSNSAQLKKLRKASPKFSGEPKSDTSLSSTVLNKENASKASTTKENLKKNFEQSEAVNDVDILVEVATDTKVGAEKAQIEIIEDVRLPQKFPLNKTSSDVESVVIESANDVPAAPLSDNDELAAPPSGNDVPASPPSDNDVPTAPPSDNDEPAEPPSDNEQHAESFAPTGDKEKLKAQYNKTNLSELESIPDISSDAIELALCALHDSPHHSDIPLSPKKRYFRQAQKHSCPSPLSQSHEQEDLLDILNGDTKSADSTLDVDDQEDGVSFVCKLTKYKANLSNANQNIDNLSKLAQPIKTVSEIVAELESVEVPVPEPKPETLKERATKEELKPMNNILNMIGSSAMISDFRKFKIPKLKRSQDSTTKSTQLKGAQNVYSIETHAPSSDLTKKTKASMASDVEKQNDLLLKTLSTEKSLDNEIHDELLEHSDSLDEKNAQTKRSRGRPRKHPVVLENLPVKEKGKAGRKKKQQPDDAHQELSGESSNSDVGDLSSMVVETKQDLKDPVPETKELKEATKKECEKADDKIFNSVTETGQSPTCVKHAIVEPTNSEQSSSSSCQSSPLQSSHSKRARLSPVETMIVGTQDTTVGACTTGNVTIDETVIEGTPNSTSQLSTVSNVSTNGGGIVTKRISLGSTDYRFEQMPNNQIKLVVTRRGRKRKAAELSNNTPIAAPTTTEPARTGDAKP